MLRWRTRTWAFIIWNVVMAALLVSNLWGDRCGDMPYGSSRTACTMGAAFEILFAFLAIVIIWPIGLVVIGKAWPRPKGPPMPRITRSHEGSDVDAVLAAAASNVAEWQTVGLTLVEAAWIARPRRMAGGPFRLGVAFGKPGIRFERLWPGEEDVTEAVLARVPSPVGRTGA